MKFITIDEVATVVRGSSPRPQGDVRYYGGNVPRLMVSDVTRDGMYVTPKIDFLTEEGATKSRPMKKGDFIIAVSGDPGEPCILTVDACIHDGFVGFRNLDISKVFTPYLYRFFKYNKLKSKSQAVGAIYKNLNTDQIKGIQIPLPTLQQQQKIANILDAADALRQNDKALIAKYDELTQALFLDMFGDPVSNPKGWKFKMLNELVSKLGDGLHGTPKYSEDGEYYFVNGNNLDNGKITISENTKRVDFSEYEKHKKDLNENTMLVSINGTIGKIAFYNNEKIILGKSACYFNLIKGAVNDIFLFHIFKSDYFLRYSSSLSTGSTIQNVSLKTMREFPIPIPPLDLQNQFAERVAVIEEQKTIAQKSLEKSEELFNSLLQKAFKGELV
jgi:type I restriction enzyme S subunit